MKLRFLTAILFGVLSAFAFAQQPPAPPNPALQPIQDSPGLPRVLLIGDSISIGYTLPVRELLKGKANVHRIPENGGNTDRGLKELSGWLGNGKWDVIHFNWGLHDLRLNEGKQAVPLQQYETNLRALLRQLQATNAKLIWCNNTPVPEGNLNPPRNSADVIAYNEAAQKVMREHAIITNDVYGFVRPSLGEWQLPVNVHFKPEGYAALAKQVAVHIEKALPAPAQNLKSNIPYATPAHERQVLDVYTPDNARNLPVVFWIHGGGWQAGDKTSVAIKPRVFTERGFVFVSTNYRFLPHVEMGVLIRDVAQSLGWVHKNIAGYGGDPKRIFVMGHSAGAQLAALLCTDDRYLKAEGVAFDVLKGCVPVDGDTYDIPAIILTAETRQTVHGLPLPTFGHRVKFGNDPRKHIDFSAVTHVAKGKGIPPFLILHVAGHPDVTAQALRFGAALKAAGVPVTVFGAGETTHNKLDADLGLLNDPATKELFKFLGSLVVAERTTR